MIDSFDYDSSHIPSMPVAEISISYAPGLSELRLTAIVDSGADSTIIPLSYLEQVGARKIESVWLRSTTSHRIEVDLFVVSLRIGRQVQREVEVVGDTEYQEVILGRNVLNHYIVTLNGLAGVVEISDQRAR